MKKLSGLISLYILSVLFTAQISYAEQVNVVVSIYPLRDIVQQVGGDRVNVNFMVPPGASPHTFEPTASDMTKISKSKLFIIIGSGLEFWADKALKAARGKNTRIIVLSKGMKLLHEKPDHEEHGGHHDNETADPHIWLDPLIVKDMAQEIADTLAEIDPVNRSYYMGKVVSFKKELDQLHTEITESIKTFRTRGYVTFHPAWNYFSRRYGLNVLGVIEESPGKEASPKHIAGIIRAIRHSGAKAVFAEPQFNPKIAEVIAKEAGARVLFLDPIGSPDLKGRDGYLALLRYNLTILQEAMK